MEGGKSPRKGYYIMQVKRVEVTRRMKRSRNKDKETTREVYILT